VSVIVLPEFNVFSTRRPRLGRASLTKTTQLLSDLGKRLEADVIRVTERRERCVSNQGRDGQAATLLTCLCLKLPTDKFLCDKLLERYPCPSCVCVCVCVLVEEGVVVDGYKYGEREVSNPLTTTLRHNTSAHIT
jgi:hypothetical protein